MYYADYHTHSRLSPDSDAPLLDMAEAAARAGLSELCITDHYDLVEMDGTPRTQPLDWPAAVAQWEEVRRRMAGRLILKLGVEFGSPTYDHTAARRTLDQSLLDFVIGSLHNYSPEAGGADFYLGDYTSPEICYAALDDYFAHMARLAPLPFYDSLGHIIYPLRYMCMRDGQSVSLDRYMDAIREILKTVVETGHGIEVNTTGALFWICTEKWAVRSSPWAPTPMPPGTWPGAFGMPMRSSRRPGSGTWRSTRGESRPLFRCKRRTTLRR